MSRLTDELDILADMPLSGEYETDARDIWPQRYQEAMKIISIKDEEIEHLERYISFLQSRVKSLQQLLKPNTSCKPWK